MQRKTQSFSDELMGCPWWGQSRRRIEITPWKIWDFIFINVLEVSIITRNSILSLPREKEIPPREKYLNSTLQSLTAEIYEKFDVPRRNYFYLAEKRSKLNEPLLAYQPYHFATVSNYCQQREDYLSYLGSALKKTNTF